MTVNVVRVNGQNTTFAAKMLGVDSDTVSGWLDAYARNDLNGLADDTPGRLPFVLRADLEKIVGGAKRFTAYEFGRLVEKKTGVQYSERTRTVY